MTTEKKTNKKKVAKKKVAKKKVAKTNEITKSDAADANFVPKTITDFI